MTGGQMSLVNSVTQLAVFEAAGTGAVLSAYNSQIWSQSILTAFAGTINLVDCSIHGNFVNADGAGSVINFSNSTFDLHNGNSSIQNCNANSAGYSPNVGGTPLCNPYNPLHGCATVIPTNGGLIPSTPVCDAYPTTAPTSAPIAGTMSPTVAPSVNPTAAPFLTSAAPSVSPTVLPTVPPSASPTLSPSAVPSMYPTTASNSTTQSNGHHQDSWSTGETAGVAVGATLGVAVMLAVVFYYLNVFRWGKPKSGMSGNDKSVGEEATVNPL